MFDSKVYLHFVTKRRQARRRIPRNSCLIRKHGTCFNPLVDIILKPPQYIIGIFRQVTVRKVNVRFKWNFSIQNMITFSIFLFS